MADVMHTAEAVEDMMHDLVAEEHLEALSFNKVRRRASGKEITTYLRKAVRKSLKRQLQTLLEKAETGNQFSRSTGLK